MNLKTKDKSEKLFSNIIERYFVIAKNMKNINRKENGISTLTHTKTKIIDDVKLIITHNSYEENNINRYYVNFGGSAISFDKEEILYGDLDFRENLLNHISKEKEFKEDKKINQIMKELKKIKRKKELNKESELITDLSINF